MTALSDKPQRKPGPLKDQAAIGPVLKVRSMNTPDPDLVIAMLGDAMKLKARAAARAPVAREDDGPDG